MPPKTKKSFVKKPTKMSTKTKNNNLAIDMNAQSFNAFPVMKGVKSVQDGRTIYPFYTTRFPFSNFYPIEFTFDGHTFQSSEQCFMYCKAKQFNDDQSKQALLKVADPKSCKGIGRSVQNFDEKVWTQLSYGIMVDVLKEKFGQNPKLKDYLMSTNDSTIVEAAPKDRIWGIGMGENDLRVANPNQWNGQNKLGRALMDVREYFKST